MVVVLTKKGSLLLLAEITHLWKKTPMTWKECEGIRRNPIPKVRKRTNQGPVASVGEVVAA